MTTLASAVVVQEPKPSVAEPVLPVVVEVERWPSADGAVAKHHLPHLRCMHDEAGLASRKARVIEVVCSSPPPVPAGHNGSPAAWLLGGWV